MYAVADDVGFGGITATRPTPPNRRLEIDRRCRSLGSEEILACHKAGIVPLVPKSTTSSAKAQGRFDRSDFVYDLDNDEYVCPAGEHLIWRRFIPATAATVFTHPRPMAPLQFP